MSSPDADSPVESGIEWLELRLAELERTVEMLHGAVHRLETQESKLAHGLVELISNVFDVGSETMWSGVMAAQRVEQDDDDSDDEDDDE